MRHSLAIRSCAALLLAACAGRAAAPREDTPPTVDPAGEYELTFVDDGKPAKAVMLVTGGPGTFGGRIAAETRPEVAITTVTASGPLVTVTADVPQGVLLLRLRLDGDSVSGNWSLR